MEYYGSWSRDQLMIINGWSKGELDLNRLFIDLYEDERWLDRLLQQFPEADTDHDGRITPEEAVKWHAARVPPLTPGASTPAWLPPGVSHWKEVVRMRDGVDLGTEVYLPEGEGPFPVLIGRGHRLRGQTDGINFYLDKGFACVSQNLAPEGEEILVGAHGASTARVRNIAEDTLELIEWTARQAWCSGKTAIFGYSAGGMATLPVLREKPSSLTAVVTHIAATKAHAVFRMRGGVASDRRASRELDEPWEPGTPSDDETWTILDPIRPEENVGIFKTDIAGWFDIFLQGSIDDWVAWKGTGRAVLVVGGGTHGAHPRPSRVPPDYCDSDIFWPDVPQFNLLNGIVDWASVESKMYYFLMGDFTNPLAPGNLWKVTREWPIPHEARSYYLTAGGTLDQTPGSDGESVSWDYDPTDPVKRTDIQWRSLIADGPVDQRSLRDRDDVVYFQTEVLTEPLEVTGRILADLFVSSNVRDTTFMVKLLDIYPDGYEAMIAHGVLMARYRDGYAHTKPLEEGEVTKLTVDLWSTAIVFDAGHRIGLYVTNSDAGRFAVHPNSWDPVASYRGAPIAHNTLHLSGNHSSRVVIPVVKPGTTEDYDDSRHRPCRKTGPWEK
ncbi:MAG: CocE/NonD family hydrolase [Spirochaetales bacterium]|nr:MAG: CocE/NonD family hydrolase [Spirochaetales bacterium]